MTKLQQHTYSGPLSSLWCTECGNTRAAHTAVKTQQTHWNFVTVKSPKGPVSR